MLEIIIVVLCSLLILILIGLTIFLVINSKKHAGNPEVASKELGAISEQIKLMSSAIEKDIQLSIAKEMIKISEQARKTSESDNEKLERFQKNITESLNNRFDALNKQIDDKMHKINTKVEEKLSEGFKGTSETMAQVRERLQAIDDAQKNIEKLSTDVVSLKSVLEVKQEVNMENTNFQWCFIMFLETQLVVIKNNTQLKKAKMGMMFALTLRSFCQNQTK